MAARTGVLVTIKREADGGESPNRYVAEITAEVRVHWPPRASQDEVLDALKEAWSDAVEEVRDKYVEWR